MDNFPVHKENVKLIEYDTNLIKVFFHPANTTRLLQPLDISINNLIKKNLRQLWVSNFTSNESVTRAEMSKRVLESWTKLTVNQIQSGFKKAALMVQEDQSMEIEYEQIHD